MVADSAAMAPLSYELMLDPHGQVPPSSLMENSLQQAFYQHPYRVVPEPTVQRHSYDWT